MRRGHYGPWQVAIMVAVGASALLYVVTSGGSLLLAEGADSDAASPLEDIDVDAMTMTGHVPKPVSDASLAEQSGEAKAVLAGGCFWCTEAVFESIDGVADVTSGYAGGNADTAAYKHVLTGQTGHAESIQITYDPSKVTYGALLRVFFSTHDPTTLNRQGADRGTQYRSAIFHADDEQKEIAAAYIAQLTSAKTFPGDIVTKLEPLDQFYPAEDYHQDYVKHNPNQPYIRHVAIPKLEKLEKLKGDNGAG